MTEESKNESFFPITDRYYKDSGTLNIKGGISKKEYHSSSFLSAMISNNNVMEAILKSKDSEIFINEMVESSIELANIFINKIEKK